MHIKTLKMKIKFFPAFFATVALFALQVSCTKDSAANNQDDPNSPCPRLSQLHAHSFAPVVKGSEIRLFADSLTDAYYNWTGPNNFSSTDQNPYVSSYASYTDRGWYYVAMMHDGCTTKRDSVYVNVTFPQGNPACTLINNTGIFNSALLLGDQLYSFVSFGQGITGYEITANSSNGDLRITLSPYWITHNFEDGIYYTTSDLLPDYNEIDQIHISDVNQGILWTAAPDKPVYISHSGNKVRVSFCNISFTGTWGSSLYTTTISAQVTQQ